MDFYEKSEGALLEKLAKRSIERVRVIHDFYCDGCGKYLGMSIEDDDGYYENKSEFSIDLNTNRWFSLKRNFCNCCQEEFIEKLNESLRELGFE